MPLDVQLLIGVEHVGVLQFFKTLFGAVLFFETDERVIFIGVFVLFDHGGVDFSESSADSVQGFLDFLLGVFRELHLVWQVFEIQVFPGLLSVGLLLKDLRGDHLVFNLKIQGSLDALGRGLDGIELHVPVASRLPVGVVAHDGGEDASELGELLFQGLARDRLVEVLHDDVGVAVDLFQVLLPGDSELVL